MFFLQKSRCWWKRLRYWSFKLKQCRCRSMFSSEKPRTATERVCWATFKIHQKRCPKNWRNILYFFNYNKCSILPIRVFFIYVVCYIFRFVIENECIFYIAVTCLSLFRVKNSFNFFILKHVFLWRTIILLN